MVGGRPPADVALAEKRRDERENAPRGVADHGLDRREYRQGEGRSFTAPPLGAESRDALYFEI